MQSQTFELNFNLFIDDLSYDICYIVGNIEELGQNDFNKRVKLQKKLYDAFVLKIQLKQRYPDYFVLTYQFYLQKDDKLIGSIDYQIDFGKLHATISGQQILYDVWQQNPLIEKQIIEQPTNQFLQSESYASQEQLFYLNTNDHKNLEESLELYIKLSQQNQQFSFQVSVVTEIESLQIQQTQQCPIILKHLQDETEQAEDLYYYLNEISNISGVGLQDQVIPSHFKSFYFYLYDSNNYLEENKQAILFNFAFYFQTSEDNIEIYIKKPNSIKTIWVIQNQEIQDFDVQKILAIHPSQAKLKIKQILKSCGLGELYYSPLYNRDWSNYQNDYEWRGNEKMVYKYHFPKGWKGYGLNTLDYYGQDQKWIAKDGNLNEWRILFHGTKKQYVQNIVQEGLKAGSRQAYKEKMCKLTGKKVGVGIYFTNHIEVAEKYSSPFSLNGKYYFMVLQCRVNPTALRNPEKIGSVKQEDDWNDDYFVVNDAEDTRIYRILVKEIKVQNQ